jgi:hypothetical protein
MYRRTNYTLFPGFVAAAVAATSRHKMLSFRPELGSPGKYIFPLGYMINAYEE